MKWETVSLGDISESIQTGPFGSQLHQSDYSESGTPVVMPKDLINGRISTDSIAHVSENHVERLSRHKIIPGDILYSRRGDVGRCAYASENEENWLCGTGCLRVTIDRNKANPKFVFYQLQTANSIGWVEKHAVGATMLNLNTSILSAAPVSMPPVEVQNRIVEVLSSYDTLIENNQKQIKLLEEAAQRLHKEWFTDFRFPGYESTPIHNGIPEGWERKTVADVCETVGGGTPSTSKPEYYDGGTIHWVTPSDLTKKRSLILLETEKRITQEGYDNSSAKMVPPETILMTSRASIGFFALCEYEVCTNQGFISCIPFSDNLRFFLLFNLMSRIDEIKGKATGSTFPEIAKRTFREMHIVVPTENPLMLFTKQVKPIISQIRVLEKENVKLRQARDRLLPKLMSGEISL